MKATFTKSVSNAVNMSREKETISCYSVLGKYKGDLRDIVTVRVYMGRSRNASTVYASIWVHGEKETSGKGSAGGYGYHKESAAIGCAIRNAGIELWGSQYADEKGYFTDYIRDDEGHVKAVRIKENTKTEARIDGVGDTAIRSALIAIGKAAGLRGTIKIVSH